MAFLDETGLAELWSLIDAKHSRIETGSYIGTGTYGESYPNSLTFDDVPKLVGIVMTKTVGSSSVYPDGHYYNNLIGYNDANNSSIILTDALPTTAYGSGAGFGRFGAGAYYGKKSGDGKTIYWYSATTDTSLPANYQYNFSGTEYFYFAIF